MCLHPNLALKHEIGKCCQNLERTGFPSRGRFDGRLLAGLTDDVWPVRPVESESGSNFIGSQVLLLGEVFFEF